ncbi:MAG: aminotransferase class V-fold PLP-dependent enzyme [Firmicutes bacterium]|nr:aminotransferase class V-fold PLP-dependent enzyme [Bacillota bacterium]
MIYLDNAAGTHPKPAPVIRSMQEACRKFGANPGRGCYRMSKQTAYMVNETREKLARFFHIARPERIVFTAGATASLNMALFGLLKPGDHLLISSMEHNALWRPAAALAREGKISVSQIQADSQGYVRAEDFAAALRPQTALIACLHGSNVNGAVQPIAAIGALAAAHGIPFLVDTAQSAGLLPVDVERDHIDLLAVAGHKYLYGLPGSGFLYVSPRVELRPLIYGGTGNKSEMPEQPDFYPDHLESGSINTLGIAALNAAVDFIQDIGPETLAGHCRELSQSLLTDLACIPRLTLQTPTEKGLPLLPAVSFTLAHHTPEETAVLLDKEFHIAVRSGYHCAPLAHQTLGTLDEGTVRLSPGWFNTVPEVKRAAAAIAQIARR